MQRLLILICVLAGSSGLVAAEPVSFEAGFAKVDVTPETPLRLSGYASRAQPSEGAQTPLHARAMALRADGGETFVLVSLDTIGTDETFTNDVAGRLKQKYGVARKRFALACSHSHTTPHLTGGITNLFTTPLTDQERKNMDAYTERLKDEIVTAVGEAIEDLAPAKVSLGRGKVGFAMNRRIVKDGTYQGMAPNRGGAVDRSVDLLKITDLEGTPRGVVFNYACHATTFGGDANQVNGDWPGYAARDIEDAHPGVTALCTIGCGADANPEPRAGARQQAHAQAHGRAMALEVGRLIEQELKPITQPPRAAFGHAKLPIDLPTTDDLKADLKSPRVQVARRAEGLLDALETEGELASSYPMPIQAWRFGDQLTMVFLGGEVVVDYALRLKKELPGERVWVTAYANDVFGYLASERVRSEGGYEVDYSMVFYNQPGRWSSGTEEIVIGRVKELVEKAE